MLQTLAHIGDSLIFVIIYAVILVPIFLAFRFLFKKKETPTPPVDVVNKTETIIVSNGVGTFLKALLFIGLSLALTAGMYAFIKNENSPETSIFNLLILFPLSFVISAILLRLGSYISKNLVLK
jgi:hypothetical protein